MAARRAPIRIGQLEVTFLLDDHDTNRQATVFEVGVPAGANAPIPHSHDGFEETAYGLSGVFTFTIDGTKRELGAGDALFIPRGVVHQFENLGEEDAVFLSVATPGVFRPAYFEEMAAVVSGAVGGPPDPAALVAVMRQHGLTPAPPR